MKTVSPVHLLFLVAVLACSISAHALDSGYSPGELIGQAMPGGTIWEGDRGWIAVVDGAGRDGKTGIRTIPAQADVFRKATFKIPQGSVDSGIVELSFDMQISTIGEGQAVGLTFGRDAEGTETGRGMRLIILGSGKLRIITPETAGNNQTLDQSTAFASGWVKVEVALDYGAREATLTLDGAAVTTQAFIVEKGSKQDSRGCVEISVGGGEGSVVDFDNFVVSEPKE